jgi:hypothetical protein
MIAHDGLIVILLGLAAGLGLALLLWEARQRRGAARWRPSARVPTPLRLEKGGSTVPDASSAALPPAPREPSPTETASGAPSLSETPIAGRPLARRAGTHRGSLWISPALPPELERARLERELRALRERRQKVRRRAMIAGAGVLALLAFSLLVPPARSALKPYATWLGIRLGVLSPPPPPEPTPPPRDLEVSYSNQVEETNGRLTFRGTVRNISTSKTFENLYAELSLITRESRLIETRIVPVRPARLRPGDIGTYELTVPASEFVGNRRVRLLAEGTEVPYRYVLPEAPTSK